MGRCGAFISYLLPNVSINVHGTILRLKLWFWNNHWSTRCFQTIQWGPLYFFPQLFWAVMSYIATQWYQNHRKALGNMYSSRLYPPHRCVVLPPQSRCRIILPTSCYNYAITHSSIIILLLIPWSSLPSNLGQPLMCSPVLCLWCLLSDVTMRSDWIKTSDVAFLFLSA